VLGQAEMHWILQHKPSELPLVRKLFNLNEREAELVSGLSVVPGRYSEVFAVMGERHQVLQVVPSPIEYWLATSNHNDVAHEALVRQANPSLTPEQMLVGLARRWPHGRVHQSKEVAA
jgi:hypothetical protein